MSQHDQMIDALRDTQDFLTECEITLHLDIAQLRILEGKIEQALAAEPAKLVPLTTLERDRIAVCCQSTQQVISATIDAMIAKNNST